MFKEEVTQYCPMCEEWAEKYKPIIDRLLHQFETYDKLKSLDVVTFAKQTFAELDQLKKENEQLKKSVRSNKDKRKKAIERYLKLKEFTNKEFQELKAENEELKKIQLGFSQGENLYNLYRYKQALQEIKEIAETFDEDDEVRKLLLTKCEDVL